MIFVFTGNGKGKTTSAFGQVLRVVGQGNKAAIFQFIKSKDWKSGEEKAIKIFKRKVILIKGGKGFVGILGDKTPFSEHKKSAKKLLEKAKKTILSRKYKLIVLDEINVALSLKLLKIKEVLEIIKDLPKDIDIIFTGRGAPKILIKRADLVTEFKEVKHYFQEKVFGQISREY